MTLIKEIIKYLEEIAPSALQENYDNSGLIVGHQNTKVKGVVICLDSVEKTIDEAIACGANLIIAHHPIVFKGMKRFNGHTYVERTLISAIKNDIAIYAIHTNLDSVLGGVSGNMARILGLTQVGILQAKTERWMKLETYVPVAYGQKVLTALGDAGAGVTGDYSRCSFSVTGTGAFMANKEAKPFVGEIDKLHYEKEIKIEVRFSPHMQEAIILALCKAHPYQEVAYHILEMQVESKTQGLGVVGELREEVDLLTF